MEFYKEVLNKHGIHQDGVLSITHYYEAACVIYLLLLGGRISLQFHVANIVGKYDPTAEIKQRSCDKFQFVCGKRVDLSNTSIGITMHDSYNYKS